MRSRAIIVLAALGGAIVSGGWLLQRGTHTGVSVFDRARLFDDVMTHVSRYYVDSIPESDLYRKAVDGMIAELGDPHTAFLAADRLRRLSESTTGRYGGVGIQIEPRDRWITVIAPLPDTPAEQAGIQTGDRIVEIEGESTEGWTADEAMKALRGNPGSRVSFAVERPGLATRLPFTVTRREIKIRSVQHVSMLRDSVGYLDMNVFSEETADDLRAGIDELVDDGAREVILDLRGNPGGLLDQGVGVSDLFLDPGDKIVGMRGRTREANRDFMDRTAERWPDLSLIVLVDSGSASASEIVAGALQDHDRAVILGTTTFGKGSAQSVFPMMNEGALKLTTALWYTPSGRSINRPMAAADSEPGESADTTRQVYTTAGGRKVVGGGGIVPDLIVPDPIAGPAELEFQQALGRKVPDFRDALNDYVRSLKTDRAISSPDFTVTPALRDGLWARMQRRGIEVDRAVYDSASALVDRVLALEIARYVFGGDAEFRRTVRDDPAIQAALALAAESGTQRELLEGAAERQAEANKSAAASGS